VFIRQMTDSTIYINVNGKDRYRQNTSSTTTTTTTTTITTAAAAASLLLLLLWWFSKLADKGVGLVNNRSRVRLPDIHCWVSTWMGEPSR